MYLLQKNSCYTLATAVAALALASATNAALIDDFNDSPSMIVASDAVGGIPTGDAGPEASAIGGFRQMTALYGTGDLGTIGIAGGGILQYANSPTSAGTLEIIYGTGGALNADLTDGGLSTGFVFTIEFADHPVDYSIQFNSSSGPIAPLSGTFPANINSTQNIFIAFGVGDYTDVDSIFLTLSPNNGVLGADLTISSIGTGVPEPTSLALMALGAAAMLRRRRA